MKISEKELNKLINECVREYIKENNLNEGFFDKLGFLGRSGANATARGAKAAGNAVGNAARNMGNAVAGAYNSAKDKVGSAYNNAKTSMQNYGEKMNQYSQAQENVRSNEKNAKIAKKMASQVQAFLDRGILDGVAWGKRAQQQGAAFVKTLNALANSGFKASSSAYRNQANRMVAESIDEEKLNSIIAESIKKNLK